MRPETWIGKLRDMQRISSHVYLSSD
jgi:hypothetical protein